LKVRHAQNGRTATLPPDYVGTSVELGYASTVHTAQGVTADTMHGVVTGGESRQQLDTMLTRGRADNHLYVSVVGDADPHKVIQPNSPDSHRNARTDPARDAAPQSATTSQREQQEPAGQLGAAAGPLP
jgi:ATP-dependent exoDNAse (exonuclease V) alpha subunit